jgi:ABC-2 type transport system permease protein
VTPFGYCSGTDLVANGSIDPAMAAIGILIGTAGVLAAYLKYTKKDIH